MAAAATPATLSHRPLARWGIVVAVAAATIGGIQFATRAPRAQLLLSVGAAVALGFAAIAFSRFPLFVAMIIGLRAAIDSIGTNGTDPGLAATGLTVVFLGAGLAWLFVNRHRARAPRELRNPLTLPVVVIVLAGTLGLLWAKEPLFSATELVQLVTVLVIVLVVDRMVDDPNNVRLLLVSIFASIVVPLVVGLYQLVTRQGLTYIRQGFGRVRGTFVYANSLGSYLAILLVFGVAVYPHLDRRWRRLLLPLGPVAALVLVYTYTRAAWIAAFVGLLVVGLLQSRRLVAALVLAPLVLVMAVPSVGARLSDLSSGVSRGSYIDEHGVYATGNSFAWRVWYWRETLKIPRNPLFGVGLGMVQETTRTKAPPHNDFVRAYVEMGWIGLIGYLWLLFGLVKLAWTASRRAPPGLHRGVGVGFAGAVAAFITLSVVENIITTLVVLWYFFAIAGCALYVVRRGEPISLRPETA